MSATQFSTARSYDALLTTTADKIHKSGAVQDAISTSNVIFKELYDSGKIKKKTVGGEQIRVGLMYQHNGTIDSYSGYDQIDVTPQDGITSMFVPWAQYGGAVSISGIQRFQNMGKERIADLLKEKMTQTTAGWAERMNKDLWALDNLTASHPFTGNSGKNIISLPLYIQQLDAATGQIDLDIGQIDQSTETWWENQNSDGSGWTTYELMKSGMSEMFNTCSQGPFGAPNLIATNQKGYELYERSMQEQIQYSFKDKASAGFESMAFKTAKLVWDGNVPDPELGAIGQLGGGAETNSAMYFINTNTLSLYVGKDHDWKPRGFQTPIDQDASTSLYLAYLQLVCDNRRKNGSVYDIPLTAT